MLNIIVSDSFKNFLINNYTKSKIARLLRNALYYQDKGSCTVTSYRFLFTTEFINYITYRTNGMLSFLPANKKHQTNEDGTWKREGRQEGKPAKVIRQLLTKKGLKLFKESDFEKFNNCYKACFCENLEINILPASKIDSIYNHPNIDDGGSLGGSCMNGDSYFDIYTNCKDLQIVTAIVKREDEDDLLVGRALLWDLKKEGITVMDRIYTSRDYYIDCFKDFAKSKGFWHKKEQSYSNKTEFVKPNGEIINKTFCIYLDTNWYTYPYIDTFTYGGDGYLTNDNTDEPYQYTYTNGDREMPNKSRCSISGDYIDDDDGVTVERGRYSDEFMHIHYTVTDVDGYFWYKEDPEIVEVGGNYYEKGDGRIFLCQINEEHYRNSDGIEVEVGCYKGDILHEDEVVSLENTNEYCWKDDDRVVVINGDYYDVEGPDICYVESKDKWFLEEDCEYDEESETFKLKEYAS